MKKIALLLFLITTSLTAQQDSQYTQYQYNTLVLNPAYAGSRDAWSGTLFYRSQWMEIEGAPTNIGVSLHAPFKERVGLGATLETDEIGPIQTYNVSANYAYQIPVAKGKLSFGLKASLMSYNANYSKTQTVTQGDEAFQDDVNLWLPNFGAGIYYFSENFVIGLAAPRLLESKLTNNQSNGVQKASSLERHYYATAGAIFSITPQLKFKPMMLAKYIADNPLSADIGANLLLKDAFGIGVSYRTNNSWNFNVLYQLKNGWRIAYAYDYATTAINQFSTGSHELMLGIDVPKEKTNVITPRYF